MIEKRVYEEIKRRGTWVRTHEVAAHLEFDFEAVKHAIARLKKRGAIVKRGNKTGSSWMAVECDVFDRRRFNGTYPRKPKVEKPVPVRPPEAPVHRSTLAQALAWQP